MQIFLCAGIAFLLPFRRILWMEKLVPPVLDVVGPIVELFANRIYEGDCPLAVILFEPVIKYAADILSIYAHLVEFVGDFPADKPTADCCACCRACDTKTLQRGCCGSSLLYYSLDTAYESLDATYQTAALSSSGKAPEEAAEGSSELSYYSQDGSCDSNELNEFPDCLLCALVESVPPFLETLHSVP